MQYNTVVLVLNSSHAQDVPQYFICILTVFTVTVLNGGGRLSSKANGLSITFNINMR